MNTVEDNSVLFARLDDLCRFARQGILGSSCFLSPRELHFATRHLEGVGFSHRFIEWGGFDGAERRKIFLLPDYIDGACEYKELFDYGFEDELALICVRGSGYKKLSHRDFLGSVLNLGLQRTVIGDILVSEQEGIPRATLVCEASVADFIVSELTRVGGDTVKAEKMSFDELMIPQKRFQNIRDTVASARADCIVSALCSLSREKARAVVADGLVEIDYEPEERPDRTVAAPCIFTVRGYGKFRINSVSEQTKKGRYRLDADKYL